MLGSASRLARPRLKSTLVTSMHRSRSTSAERDLRTYSIHSAPISRGMSMRIVGQGSSRRTHRIDGNARRRFRLACEALEDRCLMSLGDSGFEQVAVGAG